MTADLTIGRLAQATGCKVPTIRYYEQIALLPAPLRSAGNQRLYGPEHVARLAFIRHGRDLGFSQAAIRELLELASHPEQPCEAVTRVALAHLDDVKRRISRLAALRAELERMIDQCRGDRVADCRIIETLADQAHRHFIDHNQ
jgi:DNA-binding transcriptional MerR regulator